VSVGDAGSVAVAVVVDVAWLWVVSADVPVVGA
jgi:hypothetical protein